MFGWGTQRYFWLGTVGQALLHRYVRGGSALRRIAVNWRDEILRVVPDLPILAAGLETLQVRFI